MATMSATHVNYDFGHNPSWAVNQPPSSASSPSRYPSSLRSNPGYSFFPPEGAAVREANPLRSPSPRQGYSRPESHTPDPDQYDSFLPDVRVTAPSRTGDYQGGGDGYGGRMPEDDERSAYSERMSGIPSMSTSAPQYYSSVFQSSRASGQSTGTEGNFSQLFAGAPMSPTSSHHLSSMSSLSMNSSISRESWQTSGTATPDRGPARPDSAVDPFSFMQYESARAQVPEVVVSSPSDQSFGMSSSPNASVNSAAMGATSPRLNGSERLAEVIGGDGPVIIPHAVTPPPFQPPQGRVASAPMGPRNFSRPNRSAASPTSPGDSRPPLSSYPSSSSLNKPAIMGSDDAKHDVLERVQQRRTQGGTSPLASPSPSSYFASAPAQQQYATYNDGRTGASSPNRPPYPPSPFYSPATPQSQFPPSPKPSPGLVVLPASPPNLRDRHASSESLYSTYSYYNLDASKPSPPASPGASVTLSPTTAASSKKPTSPTSALAAADDFLALGIAHHEADRLAESAECFEKAANLESGGGLDANGKPFIIGGEKGSELGSAIGMLMWGLSLRHGWGVPKDEVQAFKWLKAAAEHAVVDLQKGAAKSGRDVVRKELVLAVYEVGQSFFHGWGVKKDKEMGFSYFQTAAQLGDPDAQQDLAFCFANGKGCKKDRKEAAKWYRAAAAQGASTVGLAWIYKAKFYAD